jgi:hypothetical protein
MSGVYLGWMVLSSTVLAALLVIGGVEQNPGPVEQAVNVTQCTGSSRNLKSGIQCELCGLWYHYNCGSVKSQIQGREKWTCERCKTDRFRRLQEELKNALRQIDDLKTKNRELEEKLILVGARRKDTVPANQTPVKCMVIGDSLVRGVGADHTNMRVECFPGIRAEQYTKL